MNLKVLQVEVYFLGSGISSEEPGDHDNLANALGAMGMHTASPCAQLIC